MEKHLAAAQIAALVGEGHPTTTTDVAATINCMGVAYRAQGKYDLGIEQFNQALAIEKTALGEGHPETARTKRILEYAQLQLLQSNLPSQQQHPPHFLKRAQGKHDLAIEQFRNDLVAATPMAFALAVPFSTNGGTTGVFSPQYMGASSVVPLHATATTTFFAYPPQPTYVSSTLI